MTDGLDLGPRGRELTRAKNIKPAGARELITLLGTDDEGLKLRSAAELPGLGLVVARAPQARVIRRQDTRLLPVAKARAPLADGACSPPRLAGSAWTGIEARFDVDHVSSYARDSLRARTSRDAEHIFDAFGALGAVTSQHATASETFPRDLADPAVSPVGRARGDAGRRRRALHRRKRRSGDRPLTRSPRRLPVAVVAQRADIRRGNATLEKASWRITGSLPELLELGRPETVTGQLAQFPPGQRKELVRTVLASRFPIPETLEEFRALVTAPLRHGPAQPDAAAHVTRAQRTRPKRPREH